MVYGKQAGASDKALYVSFRTFRLPVQLFQDGLEKPGVARHPDQLVLQEIV